MLLDLPCDIDDRFTLVAELGHGSHAIVYRATDRSLGREVAIKVLRSELIDSDVSERFRREIRLTSQLEHPNIAHVYDTGEFRGAPYFVTAIARGASLAERLSRERQLPVDEALSIARQIASALGHAHSAGIIHRDVKPANILLTPDGALLTDFGVARALELTPGTLATSTGVAVGTLLYMSPEQLCAEKGIDARSDQYSLALVLYEMLAGVPPHVAANAEGLRALRIAAEHSPVSLLRPSVPTHVEAAISRALSSAPADRFREVAEFASGLDGAAFAAAHRTTSEAVVRPSSFLTARRVAIGLIAVGLLSAGGVAAARQWRPTEAPPDVKVASLSSFALTVVGDTARGAPFARALSDELRAWAGVSADVVSHADPRVGTPLETRVTSIAGGIRATASLGPVRTGATRRTVAIQFPAAVIPDADSLRLLAARVLMAAMVSPDSAEAITFALDRPIQALREFAAASTSLLAGDLVQAERQFAVAARTGALPQAVVWQATVATWLQPANTQVLRDGSGALRSVSSRLVERDSLLALAILYRAQDSMPQACGAYRKATEIKGGGFAAWYGLAECLRLDSIVVSDARSPTSFRFRTSRWDSARAYEQAISRLPSTELVQLFDKLPTVTFALASTRRTGTLNSPAGVRFAGLPALDGDSIVVYPMPASTLQRSLETAVPRTYQRAVRAGREQLLRLATKLAFRAPTSVAAKLSLSRALEAVGVLGNTPGERSSESVLKSALVLAHSSADSLDIGFALTRVNLRRGKFDSASVVASWLLSLGRRSGENVSDRLVPVAVLLGARTLAESLKVKATIASDTQVDGLSSVVATAVARYEIAAALGYCVEMPPLRARAIAELLAHRARADSSSELQRWVAPGDWAGVTCPGAPIPYGAAGDDPLLRALASLRYGDRSVARARMHRAVSSRSGAAGTSIAWDTRFAELSTFVQTGDTATALQQLIGSMDELPATMDYVLYSSAQSGGFRRALALCDSIAGGKSTRAASLKPCRGALASLSMK